MSKFTDAVVTTLGGHFDAGDQPTSAQFKALITAIQEGIEEHDHSGTGDGDGADNLVGPVGIGTATIPHGAVGYAKFAIEGADASANGPHVQFTTASDDYPLLQFFNWQHDNISLYFDAYFDGTDRSSHAGSNFRMHKRLNQLIFKYDSGVAQGAVVTWNTGLVLDLTNGRVGIGVAAPVGQTHIDQAVNDAAIPTLILDQADTSEGFINFIGADRGVIDEGVSSLGSVRVEINGVVRRLACYADG